MLKLRGNINKTLNSNEDVGLAGPLQQITPDVEKNTSRCVQSTVYAFRIRKKSQDTSCTACQAAKGLKPKLTLGLKRDPPPPDQEEVISDEVTMDYLMHPTTHVVRGENMMFW